MQEIKDSGQRTEYPTGFVRDMHEGKGRFDLLPWGAIWELAKHCEEGAEKYGERNIDKGAPQHSLIDSAIRHLAKYLMGYNDENHLRAAMWNVAWALEQDTYKPWMQDIPARLELLEESDIKVLKAKAEEYLKSMLTPEETERIEEGEKVLEEAEQSAIVAVPLELIICEHMACPENADGACRKGHTTQCAGYIDPQIFD